MKKVLILLATLLIAIPGFSQIQHGYVKTISRPDKPGVFLPNVLIQALGEVNTVTSDSTGHFSIVFHEKKEGDPFIIVRAQKKGYEIFDRDKVYTFSTKNDNYLYMVDLKQLEEDKQRIEENAYRVAEENYQKKLAQLENQIKESEITIAQFEREKTALEEQNKKSRSLARTLAEHYARTNYDEIDSINQVINTYIENGELIIADSLIRFHLNFDPEKAVEQNRAAKKAIMERIDSLQNVIDTANKQREAILQNIESGKQIVLVYEKLAHEYSLLDNREKAVECHEEALKIKKIIYGENSKEIKNINKEIKEVKP